MLQILRLKIEFNTVIDRYQNRADINLAGILLREFQRIVDVSKQTYVLVYPFIKQTFKQTLTFLNFVQTGFFLFCSKPSITGTFEEFNSMAKREVPATLRNLIYQVDQNIIKEHGV